MSKKALLLTLLFFPLINGMETAALKEQESSQEALDGDLDITEKMVSIEVAIKDLISSLGYSLKNFDKIPKVEGKFNTLKELIAKLKNLQFPTDRIAPCLTAKKYRKLSKFEGKFSDLENAYKDLKAQELDLSALKDQLEPTVLAALDNCHDEYCSVRRTLTKAETDDLASLIDNEDIHGATRLGTTILHLAVFFGDKDICKRLIVHGANINARSMWQETPLHWICLWRSKLEQSNDLRLLLVNNGAKRNTWVDIKDLKHSWSFRPSPLFRAVSDGHTPLVKLFLEHNIRDCGDKDPLYSAISKNHRGIANLLITHGAILGAKLLELFALEKLAALLITDVKVRSVWQALFSKSVYLPSKK